MVNISQGCHLIISVDNKHTLWGWPPCENVSFTWLSWNKMRDCLHSLGSDEHDKYCFFGYFASRVQVVLHWVCMQHFVGIEWCFGKLSHGDQSTNQISVTSFNMHKNARIGFDFKFSLSCPALHVYTTFSWNRMILGNLSYENQTW